MIRKATHMILAALVLLSTMGITVNMHFCHDQLIDLALYAPAESCCGGNAFMCHTGEEGVEATSHCDDESIVLEALEDFMASTFAFNFEYSHSFELFSTSQFMIDSPVAKNISTSRILNYKKPPPQEVVLSQIQSFLL